MNRKEREISKALRQAVDQINASKAPSYDMDPMRTEQLQPNVIGNEPTPTKPGGWLPEHLEPLPDDSFGDLQTYCHSVVRRVFLDEASMSLTDLVPGARVVRNEDLDAAYSFVLNLIKGIGDKVAAATVTNEDDEAASIASALEKSTFVRDTPQRKSATIEHVIGVDDPCAAVQGVV